MMNNMLNHKTGNSRYSGNTGSGFTAGSPFWMLLACALLAGLLLLLPGASVAEEARDLTADCTYSWSKGSTKRMDVLYDHDYEFFWKSNSAKNNYLEVRLPEGETCSGVQIKWAAINKQWCVEVQQNGEWVAVDGYSDDRAHLTTWTALDNVTEFRIASHSNYPHDLKICELNVLSAGDRPAWIQDWEPTYEKADLMVVIAHPDDEYIFMGAVIPYYGAERGKRVLAVYITESSARRRTELLDGLWTAGQRSYPLTGLFYDRYTMNLDEAYKKVGKKKVQAYMIQVFRHYKPEVVVTHDIHGEYGHGLHKLCADIVINALKKSGNSKYDKASAKEYGLWDVPKCYIHLYPENQIIFDWSMPLSAFGGRTAFDVADEAWHCHLSQQKSKYRVYVTGDDYDSQIFGLYRSLVGPDREHTDFFENLPDASE